MKYLIVIFILFAPVVKGQIFTSYTSAAPVGPCAGEKTVVYSDVTYDIVAIGTQCWFADNLNVGEYQRSSVTQSDNSAIEKYCYEDDEGNCSTYGGLYQWEEAVNYENPDFWDKAQGICPTGWHIPNIDEMAVLDNYLSGDMGDLKESGTTHWYTPNTGATNSTGFTFLPAGYFSDKAVTFYGLACRGEFWTSTVNAPSRIRTVFAVYDNAAFGYSAQTYTWAVSIRCLKD